MSWEIAWADMCRACMDSDGELLPLFARNGAGNKTLAKKLAEMGSIEVKKNDGLPTKLCAKCLSKIDEFYRFRNLIQESDSKLKLMNNQQVVSDSNVHDERNQIRLLDGKNFDTEKIILSCDENGHEETAILHIVKDGTNTLNTEDLMESCDTIVLRVAGETEDAPEIHLLLQQSDLDQATDHSSINLSNESSDQLNNTLNTSSVVESDETCRSKEKESIENNTLISSNEGVEDLDESDSDLYADAVEHIVGSLNDTVTRVKEIKENGKVTQYQCTLCNIGYKELADAVIHVIELHVPNTGPFYCIVCEMDCDSMKQLKAHVQMHRGPTPYQCFLCNKSYIMKRYLKRHMVCHTDFARYRCPKCGKRFKVRDELDDHMPIHEDLTTYTCSQCPRVFNHKGNYKRHLISHLDPQGLVLPKYPCTMCNRRFMNNRSLITHMRIHTGEKPYKCEICSKAFSQHGNLINHRRIHTNPRSFTCEECGKSFNQKATLRDHRLIHSGEKPYVCNVCGLAYTFSAALRRHLWSHSDGKPYECEVCKSRFTGKYDLNRHMVSHTRKKKNRKKNKKKDQKENEDGTEQEKSDTEAADDSNTIFVEQIFLNEESMQIIAEGNPEKQNDSILGLIQYA